MGYRLQAIEIILCAAFLLGCSNAPDVQVEIRECASMPVGRATACACSLEGKGYVFAGREGSRYYNDLWQYDPQTDSWTNLGESPMKPRVNATIVAANDLLYMGLGYAGNGIYKDSSCLQDWWSYAPLTGEWKRMADSPNANTVACVAYANDDKIYTLYGFGDRQTQQICIYSPAENAWLELPANSNRPRQRFGECAALHNGMLYFGTGYTTDGSMSDWYAMDIEKDHWMSRKFIPGKGREFSACANTKQYVYLLGGRYFSGEMTGGEVFDSYMRYSPDKDHWEWCGTMPCGRAENQIAFSIDGKVYFGLGENEKGETINKLYCIE